MAGDSKSSETATSNVFEKHVQENAAANPASRGFQMSWMARLGIFIAFPCLVGCAGLYAGYLESIRRPEREIDFDSDFIVPFLLAMTFAIVVGFQTKGYTSQNVEPIVKWPKVRKKKVIRKVKKGELVEKEEGEDKEVEEKDTATKKDD